MESPYAIRWDKRDNFDTPADHGWIGEDRNGVWLARHPEMALAEHPRIWDAVTEMLCGASELTTADIDCMSAVHVEARMVMAAAQARASRQREGGGRDGG